MGRPVIGSPKQHVTLTLDPKQLKAVDRIAKQQSRGRSEIVREALGLWLEWQRQEEEIDRNLAREAAERIADDTDTIVPYEQARARLGL